MSNFLVVRTEPAASETVAALRAYGHQALALPLLRAVPCALAAADKAAVRGWRDFNTVIIVSAHAARYFLAVVGDDTMPSSATEWLAIGAASAAPLLAAGISCQIPERPAGSEALLAVVELAKAQVEGRDVLLLEGENSRGLLARTLLERGAKLTTVALYAREPNPLPEGSIAAALAEPRSAMVVGSGELLTALLGHRALIAKPSPLLLPSPRIAKLAQGAGYTDVYTLDDLDADTLHGWALLQQR